MDTQEASLVHAGFPGQVGSLGPMKPGFWDPLPPKPGLSHATRELDFPLESFLPLVWCRI